MHLCLLESGRVRSGGFYSMALYLEVSIREGSKLGEGPHCAASSICAEDIRLLSIINEVEKTEQADEFWPSSERCFEVSHVDVTEEVAFG